MECRVTGHDDHEGRGWTWTLDANSPYAGYYYEADVTLDAVEDGPDRWDYVDDVDEVATASTVEANGHRRYKVATFALGCFWGGELAYQRQPGVISTHVGYARGHVANPTYEMVCSGSTGHTEAIRIVYDETTVSYESLVRLGLERLGDDVYEMNRVGNDVGTQYRHGIYYHDNDQRMVAERLLGELSGRDRDDGGLRMVMTELEEAREFYLAEEYHQQYLMKGGQSARKGSSANIRCYG